MSMCMCRSAIIQQCLNVEVRDAFQLKVCAHHQFPWLESQSANLVMLVLGENSSYMKLRWALLASQSLYYYFTLQRSKLRQKRQCDRPKSTGRPQGVGMWGGTVSSLVSYTVFYSYNYFQPQKLSVQHCRSLWALGSSCRFRHHATCLRYYLCLPVMFQKLTKSGIFLNGQQLQKVTREISLLVKVQTKTKEFRHLVIKNLFIYLFLLVCLFETLLLRISILCLPLFLRKYKNIKQMLLKSCIAYNNTF